MLSMVGCRSVAQQAMAMPSRAATRGLLKRDCSSVVQNAGLCCWCVQIMRRQLNLLQTLQAALLLMLRKTVRAFCNLSTIWILIQR